MNNLRNCSLYLQYLTKLTDGVAQSFDRNSNFSWWNMEAHPLLIDGMAMLQ